MSETGAERRKLTRPQRKIIDGVIIVVGLAVLIGYGEFGDEPAPADGPTGTTPATTTTGAGSATTGTAEPPAVAEVPTCEADCSRRGTTGSSKRVSTTSA